MDLPNELRPNTKTKILLSGGETVALPTCKTTFRMWSGAPLNFDFGKKPVINFSNEPLFAELVILHLLTKNGWGGVWVETYGGTHYVRTMPNGWSLKSEHVSIPEDKEAILKKIWKTAKTSACFDVFAWKNEDILFCEAKRTGKDRLTDAQLKFIEGALASDVTPESMFIVEWSEERADSSSAERLNDSTIP